MQCLIFKASFEDTLTSYPCFYMEYGMILLANNEFCSNMYIYIYICTPPIFQSVI